MKSAAATNGHSPTKMDTNTATTTIKKRHGKTVLFATVLSLLVDLIGFTMILPLLPSILQSYKKTDNSGLYTMFADFAQVLGHKIGAPSGQSESVLIGGVLGSLYCFLQFLSAPFLGAIADAYGRRIALLTCLVGICLSHGIWLYATNFGWFILARLIGGLSRANVSISTTIVADDCTPELRPKGMALIGGAFSIGFTAGPAMGAYFARSGDFTTPAIASLLLSTLSLILVFFFVPETLPEGERADGIKLSRISLYTWPPSLLQFKAVSTGKNLIPIGLTYFIYIFFYSGLEFTLTFLTHEKFKYTPADQGKMFTFIGITMTLIQGGLTRRLTSGMEMEAAMFGILIMIPAFMIIGISIDAPLLYLGLICYSFGSATVGPCLTSILVSRVPNANETGVALGTFRSLGALARAFGPLVSAGLFWCYGPEIAYVFGAVAFLVPLFLLRGSMPGQVVKVKKT